MFSKFYNLYWHIRYTRNPSVKRRYYRYVLAEKKRLLNAQALIRKNALIVPVAQWPIKRSRRKTFSKL